jgi:hypothetical protein
VRKMSTLVAAPSWVLGLWVRRCTWWRKWCSHLNDVEEKDCHLWVLDTGTMNHMTGCRSTFSNLDCNIHGTIKFGDGSMV